MSRTLPQESLCCSDWVWGWEGSDIWGNTCYLPPCCHHHRSGRLVRTPVGGLGGMSSCLPPLQTWEASAVLGGRTLEACVAARRTGRLVQLPAGRTWEACIAARRPGRPVQPSTAAEPRGPPLLSQPAAPSTDWRPLPLRRGDHQGGVRSVQVKCSPLSVPGDIHR